MSGLGVFAPERLRAVVVISAGCELAVTLRDGLDRAYVVVREVRPPEALGGMAACLPWPWMVVGDLPALDRPVARALRQRPTLVLWHGELAPGLPRHARSFDRHADLVAAARGALERTVGGMRLAVGVGIELPDGRLARSAELEALVASHPHPLHAPLSAFRGATQLLAASRVPLEPARHPRDSSVHLRWRGG